MSASNVSCLSRSRPHDVYLYTFEQMQRHKARISDIDTLIGGMYIMCNDAQMGHSTARPAGKRSLTPRLDAHTQHDTNICIGQRSLRLCLDAQGNIMQSFTKQAQRAAMP